MAYLLKAAMVSRIKISDACSKESKVNANIWAPFSYHLTKRHAECDCLDTSCRGSRLTCHLPAVSSDNGAGESIYHFNPSCWSVDTSFFFSYFFGFQFGVHFVRFTVEACHAAKVPISVHVDHAGNDEDITRVLDFADQGAAVDSIMIDCSHHETDEDNIAMAKPYVLRASKLGMAVEVELGRLAGGEDGVRTIDEGALTKPSKGKKKKRHQFSRELYCD